MPILSIQFLSAGMTSDISGKFCCRSSWHQHRSHHGEAVFVAGFADPISPLLCFGQDPAKLFYPAIIAMHSSCKIKGLPMGDIYATPESDVVTRPRSERAGGNVDDAIDGNIDVAILETLGEAWRDLKGFKLKCHVR